MSQQLFNCATRYFHDQIKKNNKAMDYLLKRGLSEDIINYFKIGYADGNIKPYLFYEGFSQDDILESKLMVDYNGKIVDFFRNRIIFPITMMGNTLFMSGRDLAGTSDRKYLNLAIPNNAFINEEILLKKPRYIILTEGFMDCYTLLMNKFPAIGLAGCNRKKKGLLEKLKDIPNIYIMFDTDSNEAGQKGANKTAYQLCKTGHQGVRVITLPALGADKMDINNLYIENKEQFPALIKQLLIDKSITFDKTDIYQQMFQEEMNKPIRTDVSVSVAESLNIYHKHLLLQGAGDRLLRCPCPFHNETKPSFTIYTQTGYAICFGCDKRFHDGKEFEDEYLMVKKARSIKI